MPLLLFMTKAGIDVGKGEKRGGGAQLKTLVGYSKFGFHLYHKNEEKKKRGTNVHRHAAHSIATSNQLRGVRGEKRKGKGP